MLDCPVHCKDWMVKGSLEIADWQGALEVLVTLKSGLMLPNETGK
jgi:hypothetical protein